MANYLRAYNPTRQVATRQIVLEKLSQEHGRDVVIDALTKKCSAYSPRNQERCREDVQWLREGNEVTSINVNTVIQNAEDVTAIGLEDPALRPMIIQLLTYRLRVDIDRVPMRGRDYVYGLTCIALASWLIQFTTNQSITVVSHVFNYAFNYICSIGGDIIHAIGERLKSLLFPSEPTIVPPIIPPFIEPDGGSVANTTLERLLINVKEYGQGFYDTLRLFDNLDNP